MRALRLAWRVVLAAYDIVLIIAVTALAVSMGFNIVWGLTS